LNKSSLLLKNILQSAQTLQLFTKIIKTESIYESNEIDKLEGLDEEIPSGLIKRGKKRERF
jgi:hypothetical protein